MPLTTRNLSMLINAEVPNIVQVSAPDQNDKQTWFVVFNDDSRWHYSSAAKKDTPTTAKIRTIMTAFSFSDVPDKDVKAECERRILKRYPEWKQRNMEAKRGNLLAKKLLGEEWTPEQEEQVVTITAAWSWIEDTRAASDNLESMKPIPMDFKDDKHWPST